MLSQNLFIQLRRYSQFNFNPRIIYEMHTAYFKKVDDRCNITFRYNNPEFNIDKVFNFSRNLNEKVDVCLERIKNNVGKEFEKKLKNANKKKKKQESVEPCSVAELKIPELQVNLLRNGSNLKDIVFDELISCSETTSDKYTLRILDDQYQVMFNCPWVEEIKMPTSILANYFVYPSKLELLFAEKSDSEFRWYKGLPNENETLIEWAEVGRGFTYRAGTGDIGHKLKVVCVPKKKERAGPEVEAISKCEVQADPGQCPFDTRHLFTTQKLEGSKFRVISYNLLADLYADSDTARNELFPYCPQYAMNIDYRKQLFMKEILGYHADVMCLCEVDEKVFDLDLTPVLSSQGYEGTFKVKGLTREGLATFWNTEKFDLIEKRGLNIGEHVEKLPEFKVVWENVQTNEALMKRLTERSTALQVTLLQVKNSNRMLLIANTHLYFHPDADHIRLLQGGLSMLYIENYLKELRQSNPDKNIALIFCGDFNSVPECGIYKLMTEGFVPSDFIDWSSKETEAVKGLTLSQPFQIRSAYPPELPFTNFTPNFTATLDYIFYESDKLTVDEVIPIPSEEELNLHVAIPSIVSPSDHIALVANLDWK